MGVKIGQFGAKGRVVLGLVVGSLQVENQRHQRFGHEPSAVNAEMPLFVGAGPIAVQLHCGFDGGGHGLYLIPRLSRCGQRPRTTLRFL